VIGFSSEQSDSKQKREEQEDYAIMMAERKKSKTLGVDKLYLVRPPLLIKLIHSGSNA
jgi:hypothetical protein